jgi:quinolinate synthase
MAMNALDNLHAVLESGANEVRIDPRIAEAARLPIERMLRFAAERGVRVQASGDAALDASLFAHTGMA